MLTTVNAGPYTIKGVSIGGVYTSLFVSQLGAAFDVGAAPRSFAGAKRLFLSHGHVDHSGALATLLGIRGLMSMTRHLQVYMPAEIVQPIEASLEAQSAMQRYDLEIESMPMSPGDELALRNDLSVRAFRTLHPVPSLGYQFFRRVNKLKPEFADMPGAEIGERRKAGEDLFEHVDHLELAYATDTLAKVLDNEPSLYKSRVLILECTFLDERKSLEAAWAGCHIHLDDLLERADKFENEHIVLMHFSQLYKPTEIPAILEKRCPPELFERIVPFAPARREWPG